jgi:hypothetical protein
VANSATATSGSMSVNTSLNKVTWTASGPLPTGSVTRISFQVKLNTGTTSSPFISLATMQATGTVQNSKTAQAFLVQSAPTVKKIYMPMIKR